MSYQVGIDLGTTYTAAAVYRDNVARIFPLGSRSAVIPSVVLLRSDGTILTGDAADRRAMSEPERVVREFKRRLGDTTPVIVGGTPYSAEALTARLLESVMAEIEKREDGPPSKAVITHPANWGNYKRDLLDQAVRMAGLDRDMVEFITEPEAAALAYATQERVEAGEVIAVYDLGGGTFDAAVLSRTPTGFEILGKPEGIERLGGIDFDAAVFAHVTSGLGEALAELDHEDPVALAAVARLRQDCVDAKEALSSDTDASIAVMLPNLQTEVRITRSEFEGLIRPTLLDTIEAMKRAVRAADLELDAVSRVLLVGGSSRIPLISLLVATELGRPVAVDAHPKHAVALGAAGAAAGLLNRAPSPSPSAGAGQGGGNPGAPVDPNLTVVARHEVVSAEPEPTLKPSGPPKAKPVSNPGPPPKAAPVGAAETLPPAQSPRQQPPAETLPPAQSPRQQPPAGRPGVGQPPPKAAPASRPGVGQPPQQPPAGRPGVGQPPQQPPAGRPGVGQPPPKAAPVGGVGSGAGTPSVGSRPVDRRLPSGAADRTSPDPAGSPRSPAAGMAERTAIVNDAMPAPVKRPSATPPPGAAAPPRQVPPTNRPMPDAPQARPSPPGPGRAGVGGAASPPGAPSQENEATTLYRPDPQVERTQVYPGGGPLPNASQGPGGHRNPARGNVEQLAPGTSAKTRSGSPIGWFVLGLLLVALVVLLLLVLNQS